MRRDGTSAKIRAEVPRLSKSRFCTGIQCLKALYLKVHDPELAGPVDASQQMIFDQGTEVGVEARKQYSGGILIEWDYLHSTQALKATEDAIVNKPTAIFEAAFVFNNIFIRIDILKNNSDGTWDIIEVKSTTDLKEFHIPDIAIQRYVAEAAGLKISRVLLKHLNRECVYPNLKNLFVEVDCTDTVKAELKEVPGHVTKMFSALAASSAPSIEIGPHCDTPYECAFKVQCWSHIPEHSVFELNGVWGKNKFELYRRGIHLIKDIKEGENVSRAKPQQLEAVRNNTPVVDVKGLKKFLSGIEYPISFFDFETLNRAIPEYSGLRPYSQLPFQFSCHIREKKDAELTHIEYLAEGSTDPRHEVAQQLLQALRTKGTILAYNAAFEKSRIEELATHLPSLRKELLDLLPRFIDLKDAFSKHYYHPDFHGSFSIKDVLPVLVPKMTYDGMAVSDGGGAQVTYLKLCDHKTSAEEKSKYRTDLLEYCKQDTMAMVQLLERVTEFVNK